MKNKGSANTFEAAKAYAFFLLKFRLRTEKEIYQRLKKKSFDQAVILQAINFLKEKAFINDLDFARAWVASRINKPIGLRRLEDELKQKGVSKEIIQAQLSKIKEDYPEEEIVAGIVNERLKKLKGIEPQKAKTRIYAYLMRRGFSPDIVIEAVRQL